MKNQSAVKSISVNLPEALALGVSLCREGKFAQAEQLYGTVLAKTPDQFDSLLNLGRILRRRRKPERALDLLRRAVAVNPKVAAAHGEIANALIALDRPEEAAEYCRQAIALRPDDAGAHATLGTALQSLGRHDAAIDAYRKAIALGSQLPWVYNNLGAALSRVGKVDEAIGSFRQATVLDPNLAEAFDNLATLLRQRGKLDEAADAYRQSISLKPDNPVAHDHLGGALQSLGRYAEAVEAHKAALAIAPDSAQAYHSLANALFSLNRHEEAVGCYQRSISLKPDYAIAFSNMGLTLEQLGRGEEAHAAFAKSIELAPENIEFHYKMVDTKRFAAGDPQVATLEKLAETMASRPAADQIKLHFILAKAYDDQGRHERAFEHLSNGNALVRRTATYDDTTARRSFDRIRAVFTADLLHAKAGEGHPTAAPVFIVGMPRSGTTLVEQILAGHPRVYGAGELTNFGRAMAASKAADGRPLAYPDAVRSMSRKQLFEIGATYVASLPVPLPPPDRIIDKMPGNFTWLGLIHLALPNARIIHLRRDPMDTCVSCYSKLFLDGHSYSYDLGELGRYYRAYETHMAHWREVLPAGTMLEVHYEELVGDLEEQARQMVEHCGLEWDEHCLTYQHTAGPVRTASFSQVRRALYTTSIGRWRRYEDMLGPLIEALAAGGVTPAATDRAAP